MLRFPSRRLQALRDLDLLDRPVEDRFTDLVLVARHLFEMPMVSITLLDEKRQWRLSYSGDLDRETPLEGSICATAMVGGTSFVIDDLRLDARYQDNPFVLGEPFLRFYAGHPLHAPDGEPLGVMCVMDVVPRHLRPRQLQDLLDVTHAVEREIARTDPSAAAARRGAS